MERSKLYKLIIAVLVIINVGMMIFFLTRRPEHKPPKAGDLVNELGIEGDKSSIITKLEKEHHQKKKSLMKMDSELHEELFSKIGTDEDVSTIQAEIHANYIEIEKITYTFFNGITKHCTPEQAEKLKKTIHRAFRQMRGPKK